MNRPMCKVACVYLVLCAAGGMVASGEPSDATPSQDAAPLGGPSATAPKPVATVPLSIVERDFEGKLIKIDRRPEVAAVEKLALTVEKRKEIDDFLTARFAKVSAFTKEHYDLFIKLQGARQAQSREELPSLMRQMREAAGDFVNKPLVDELAALVSKEQGENLRRMVREYMVESAKSEPRQGPAGAGPGRADGPPVEGPRAELNLFIREMARGFAAMVAERKQQSDEQFKRVQATPEQEAKIRAIIRSYNTSPGTELTREQRMEMTQKILAELTPEQRQLWQQRER